jgi:hypothetical protein
MMIPVYELLMVTLLQVSPAPPPDVDQLAWMAGSWKSDSGRAVVEEHWTTPSAGSMVGMNRTVFGGKKVSFEFLRIEARPDGVFYLASPGGRPPTPFKLMETQKQKVVFENPEHDFPQRVLYWKNGEELCARIEGTRQGKTVGEGWCWKPMK